MEGCMDSSERVGETLVLSLMTSRSGFHRLERGYAFALLPHHSRAATTQAEIIQEQLKK